MEPSSIAATLKAKGQKMTLTRTTLSAYDPVTGAFGNTAKKTYTVYGITTNAKGKPAEGYEDGGVVKSGAKEAKIQAGVVIPTTGDVLTIMGEEWTVKGVNPLNPQGVDLMYTIDLECK